MKTVVLLSGGLDSALVLAMALRDGEASALTIDYGQRHRREIESARAVADHYCVPHTIASIDPVLFGGSALTFDRDVPDGAAAEPDATGLAVTACGDFLPLGTSTKQEPAGTRK